MEGSLAELLRDVTGIADDQIARAIIGVGDLRVNDYGTIIKRVAAIRDLDTSNLQWLLHWVSYFNDVRKVIAHKPCGVYDRDMMRFHNFSTAKAPNDLWTYHCSVGELKKARVFIKEVDIGLTAVQQQFRGHDFDFSIIDVPQVSPDEALLQKLGLPARPADTRRAPKKAPPRQPRASRPSQ